MTKQSSNNESNARIFGLLSIVFCLIPLIGIVFGIVATQKGRNGVSSFAIKAGWTGIILSIVVAALVGYWKYEAIKMDERRAKYESCIQGRLNDPFSSAGVYSVAEAQCDWARP